jgi:hypothetical protein
MSQRPDKDPFEIAIDQILEGADGDARLALRTMLVQRLELERRLQLLMERLPAGTDPTPPGNNSFN